MEHVTAASPSRPAAAAVPHAAAFAGEGAKETLNKINMNIRGDKVHLEGLLDHAGLLALEKKIVALKVLLHVTTEANDTGDNEDDDAV